MRQLNWVAAFIVVRSFHPSFAEELVVQLDSTSFDSFITKNKKVLVEFFAPWCGHCKKLAPELDKAADRLKGVVPFAKVDATVDVQLASKYQISSYPHLLWFEDGRPTLFDGGRTAEGIEEWANAMTGPPVAVLAEPPTGYSGPGTGVLPDVVLYASTLAESFETVSKMNRRLARWFFVEDKQNQKIVIYHRYEEPVQLTYGLTRVDAIENFFKEHQYPLFGALEAESWNKYLSRGTGLVWCLFSMKDSSEMTSIQQEHRETIVEVAKNFKGRYSMTYSDTTNPKFLQQYERRLGVTEFPVIAVNKQAGDQKRYLYRGDMKDAAAITQFIKDVDDGRVMPFYRSQPAPSSNSDAAKAVVGSTLVESIFQADKDVMLHVHAPWCGDCKRLSPEYENVAKTILKEGCEDLVTLVHIDGIANDSPSDELQWKAFPTIYFVKAGSQTVDKYEGELSYTGIWKWIRRNASKKNEMLARIAKNKDKQNKAAEL